MLFLGTKKYPDAGEYQAFISNNGGSHNAYTSGQHTNYFFDINPDKLDLALDRFSQFFIEPLFDEFYVERERNAVYSEYQAGLNDDFRRSYDVYRSVINPQHPAAKFSVGNLQTLADRPGKSVRSDLLDFYQRHYSANKMTLVVLGKEPIAQLQAMVVNRFKPIPMRSSVEKQTAAASVPLFLPGQLPLEVAIKPLKDLRQMSMTFVLPSVREFYQEKPLDYIAYLLGHEGKGSLLSLLKQQGLAESLSAGGDDNGDGSSSFYISMQLTEKGLTEKALVRSLVFYAIEQIKKQGVVQWRYDEQKLLANMAFLFREKSSAVSTVKYLASNLHEYPPDQVISGDYLFNHYDPALIQRFLSLMTVGNLYVSVTSPDAEVDKITQYYQTPYSVTVLTQDMLNVDDALTRQFDLPEKNPFIPINIQLYPKDALLVKPLRLNDPLMALVTQAQIIESTKSEGTKVNNSPAIDVQAKTSTPPAAKNPVRIWVKQDISFGVPKAKVFFRILSPHVSGNLKGVALNTLYVELLKDRLNEYLYAAELAGASLSIQEQNRGIDLVLQGYQDKLPQLMTFLVQDIERGEIDSDRFAQLKSDLLRYWRNSDKKTPYHQLYNQLAVDLYDAYWADSAKINALEAVTFDDMKTFASEWRRGIQIKGLLYGNLDRVWSRQWQPLLARLPLPEDKSLLPVSIAKLQSRSAQYSVRTVEHGDQAVGLYLQGLDNTVQDQALMSVLRQIMQSPFYTSLRTEQQLGYVVFMGSLQLKQVPGSVFIVQSPSASVNDIRKAIEQFIVEFKPRLPDDIKLYQQAAITQLLEAPASLSAMADDYWNNLLQDNVQFAARQQLADAIAKITASELRVYFERVFLSPAHALWVFSRAPSANGLQQFQRGDQFYSYP